MSLVDGLGCWARVHHPLELRNTSALFLDRDGVIIDDVGYLSRPEGVRLIDGAASAIARVNALAIPVVSITNQSGIGRGFYTWGDFEAVQDALDHDLMQHSAHLDMVLACGYHDVGHGELGVADHAWRKPNPGMLLAARDRLRLNLEKCFIVGDRLSDLEAGCRAGVRRGALVRSGYVSDAETGLASLPPGFSAIAVDSLAEAIDESCAFLSEHDVR